MAELTSLSKKDCNDLNENLYIRISKLESKVAELSSMNVTLFNLTNSLQDDIAELKSAKRKFDTVSVDVSQTIKKRKLSSDSNFTGKAFREIEAVKVYTDGSCFHNGRHDASAGIGVYWGPDSQDNISEKLPGRQTNNRAEIYAAIRAIQQAIQKNIKNLIIHTDSMFLINCITKWIHYWKRSGWLKSDGNNVINKEELQELDALLKNINVKWVHVDAHCGIPGNEAADQLAVQGAGCKKSPVKFFKKQKKSRKAN